MTELRIPGFAGSLRRSSFNRGLLRAAGHSLPGGVALETFDLAAIPLYNADHEAAPPTAVSELAGRVASAEAVLIVTPEYNFSIPEVLKNAIDWISRIDSAQGTVFQGKPVGIIGASIGPLGSARAQYDLRRVFQSLEAYPMPRPERFVTFATKKFTAEGDLIDDEARQALARWLAAFAAWSHRIRSMPTP